MLLEDYHVHCLNSPDSREPLEMICQGAIEAGIREIMVTDHYEMFKDADKYPPYRQEYLDKCVQSVEECRDKFEGRLYVGLGIELGQWHLQRQAADMVVGAYPFDYVIGSFHKLDDIDLKFFHYKELDSKKLCRRYLEELLLIAGQGDFDCMAHLDLIKRYAAEQGVSIRAEDEEELVREILKTLIKRGKGLEVNTSGLRQAVKEMFPSADILRWYREEGGSILTIGSDAHRRQDVGAGFEEAGKLLSSLGFLYVSHFRGRKLTQKKIE
ncbi:MAG: histidinol-phosphatase HisJ family protein [Hungatella sp.]|jgi:histidinol-phosphatase (PHP family)|nr:histidinol-phosphatase HisJ family protein [Hungatella sp.]